MFGLKLSTVLGISSSHCRSKLSIRLITGLECFWICFYGVQEASVPPRASAGLDSCLKEAKRTGRPFSLIRYHMKDQQRSMKHVKGANAEVAAVG